MTTRSPIGSAIRTATLPSAVAILQSLDCRNRAVAIDQIDEGSGYAHLNRRHRHGDDVAKRVEKQLNIDELVRRRAATGIGEHGAEFGGTVEVSTWLSTVSSVPSASFVVFVRS